MTVSLTMVGTAPKNLTQFTPFERIRVWSGQVAGDASGGEVDFNMSLLTSGEAKHIYLLKAAVSAPVGNWADDFAVIQRSVSPQWNLAPGITTGLSIAAMLPMDIMDNATSGPAGITPPGLALLPMYLGQVESAGSSLLRCALVNINAAIMTASFLIGYSTEFIPEPPDKWPLF
jgi:hypothetical protein